jgi:hypothetical protein
LNEIPFEKSDGTWGLHIEKAQVTTNERGQTIDEKEIGGKEPGDVVRQFGLTWYA